jgi:eukaryotic-like serine/threonine-protein kinase
MLMPPNLGLPMLYCINPRCQNRENLASAKVCQVCQTPLLIQRRYRIQRPLCQRPQSVTELFIVEDLDHPSLPLVLKTLTSQDDKLRTLFQREQTLLMQVRHNGIPKGYDQFSISLVNGLTLDCIVMEQIIGEDLEEWKKKHGNITEPEAIDWLKQLLHALDYIHQKNFFHRDIKPSNIMRRQDGKIVLIDFGSVRQVTETVVNNLTITTVVSFGYTAPEQIAGKAVLQSDFYALGQTFKYLLSETETETPLISAPLAKLLKQMTAHSVSERPQTAKQILQALHRVEHAVTRKWRQRIRLSFMGGLICGGLAMIPLTKQIDWEVAQNQLFPQATCDQATDNQISCGEESLISQQGAESFFGDSVALSANTKRRGIELFREQQWLAASAQFQIVWQQTRDPEALIYLNNAKIHADPALQIHRATIVVVVPVGKETGVTAMANGMDLLRGVAQAQAEAIERKLGLYVILVDDQNDPEIARQRATELVRRPEILAVIGHPVSDTSLAAVTVYERFGMLLIAPSSTSDELATYTLKRNPIFFRTVPSNRINAAVMANLLLRLKPVPIVAVFYNPDKSYSRSLAGAFKETFQLLSGKVVSDPQGLFHLSCSGSDCRRPEFDMRKAMNYAKAQGADVFVVLPDANESRSNAWTEALKIVREEQARWIVMGDTMSREPKLLIPEAVGHAIIASAWDPVGDPKSNLVRFWQAPANITPQPVTWRTYTSYNAAQVLITAIHQRRGKKITRDLLRQQISAPNFSAPGASGPIRFREGTGELQIPRIVINQVLNCNKPEFQPLTSPDQLLSSPAHLCRNR